MIAALVGAFSLGVVDYRRWRTGLLRGLMSGSRVVVTARGPVEYDMKGEGTPIMIAHGMSGGYDQGNLLAFALGTGTAFRLIVPSRPGYLRTPLGSGPTPADQADLYAALLDTLAIRKAAIIAYSGGGPSALQFALRHPERCLALVLLSALTHPFDRVRPSPMRHLMGRITSAVRNAPACGWLVSRILTTTRFSVTGNDSEGRAITRQLWRSILPGSLRRIGVRNDDAQWDVMEVYDLAAIRAPTLVVQGSADATVHPAMGDFAAGTIPDAEYVSVPGGNHLMVFSRRTEVGAVVRRFLHEHV